MTKSILIILLSLSFMLFSLTAAAEQNNSVAKSTETSDNSNSESIETSVEKTDQDKMTDNLSPENTLAACADNVDNDGDTFLDCADQDCQIYAICLSTQNTKPTPSPQQERGNKQCRDGQDNDADGKIDCFDASCKTCSHCRKEMYEYPQEKVPMHFFISAGFGLALPNYNWKDNQTNSVFGNDIPFDPDLGGMVNLKAGFAPLQWVGFGINLNGGGTFASNREDFISMSDKDSMYKYDGYKTFGHVGGFVRLQFPFKRVVPHLDVAAGYSFSRYKWKVYSADTDWDDIDGDWDDDWDSDDEPVHDTKHKQSGHFTLALEPGIDVYVIDKTFAVGTRAWLPVFASSNSEMDNIGVMFTLTYTPTWRGQKKIKEEYQTLSRN